MEGWMTLGIEKWMELVIRSLHSLQIAIIVAALKSKPR